MPGDAGLKGARKADAKAMPMMSGMAMPGEDDRVKQATHGMIQVQVQVITCRYLDYIIQAMLLCICVDGICVCTYVCVCLLIRPFSYVLRFYTLVR